MRNLFGSVVADALFSEDRRYRYMLFRQWNALRPTVGFIGLNPSTANETQADPTITKVTKIAYHNGFGGLYMLNLFAIVSSDPDDILRVQDPIGNNDFHLRYYAHECAKLVLCWGNFKQVGRRAAEVLKLLSSFDWAFHYLTLNQNGSPKHPLYCRDNTRLTPFHTKRKEAVHG